MKHIMQRAVTCYRPMLETLIPVMALLMFGGAVTRYIFAFSPAWLTELVSFLHAVIFLSLAGYALRDDKHVRIDMLSARLPEKAGRVIDIVGFFILLVPYCGCIAWYSYDFIAASWHIHEGSREYNGMPGVFILKTFIWVYTFVLLVDGFRVLVLGRYTIESDKEAPACS